jgi:hypothetical protein
VKVSVDAKFRQRARDDTSAPAAADAFENRLSAACAVAIAPRPPPVVNTCSESSGVSTAESGSPSRFNALPSQRASFAAILTSWITTRAPSGPALAKAFFRPGAPLLNAPARYGL